MLDRRPPPDLALYLIRILQSIHPDARLVEFAETVDHRYVIRLELPRAQGKSFRLPKRLVEGAATKEWVARLLHRILRTEVTVLIGQAHAEASRLLLRELVEPRRPPL